MELWEGDSSSRVCRLFCLQGKSHVPITHDALDINVQGIPLALALPPPPDIGPHWTRPPWPLDMELHCTRTPLTAAPGHRTSLYKDPWPPLLVTSGGQDWRPVQTCSPRPPNQYWNLVAKTGDLSNLFTWGSPTSAASWWLLKDVRSAQVSGSHPTGILFCFQFFWVQ